MQIKTATASWSILFILPLSYAAINYIFDFFADRHFGEYDHLFVYYIFIGIICREFFIYPSILLYGLLFKANNQQALISGFIYTISVSLIYGFGIFMEEPLLNNEVEQFYRKILLYPATAILLFLYYEYGTTRRIERAALQKSQNSGDS
jgi:hypothetical protein